MVSLNVMQVIDSLDAGGAERVAVNVANLIPRPQFSSWICTTRYEGSLAALVGSDVGRLALNRKTTCQLSPIRTLVSAIDRHDIHILHAHSSAVFVSLVAASLRPRVKVIWHIHDPYQVETMLLWLYRVASRRVSAVLAVSAQVADWATKKAWISPRVVTYLPNFSVTMSSGAKDEKFVMPGKQGRRITCIANIRPQKDHFTLLAAFQKALAAVPDAHLLLVGGATTTDERHFEVVREDIGRRNLQSHVSMLGERMNVAQILAQSDIGVLSSRSEGFPLVLVEYGYAGLPVVATRVGQCPEVLGYGAAGVLVDPADVDHLAAALTSLLQSSEERRRLGAALQRQVREHYQPTVLLGRICELYERVSRTH
jgi:glycosyltransferase involved in cell wall biosynthesis